MTDADAIARSRSEPAAFETVFDRHVVELHRYLARRVGRDLADDLVAEVFETAFRKRGSYDTDRADARPWLYGIAHNVLRGHRRTEVRRLRAYARTGVDPVAGAGGLDEVADRLDARAEGARLARALAALKPRDRETLLLHAWGDLSYDEIAAALKVPVGTVRSRLTRARAQLRERLSDRNERLGGNGQGHVGAAFVPHGERTW